MSMSLLVCGSDTDLFVGCCDLLFLVSCCGFSLPLSLSLFSHTLFAHSVCTPRRHETSRRDLLKRCNNDVLVVLDHLRANLRIQLAFKEDYEQELKSTIDRRRSVHVRSFTPIYRLEKKAKHSTFVTGRTGTFTTV
jgi:hypothetical protein